MHDVNTVALLGESIGQDTVVLTYSTIESVTESQIRREEADIHEGVGRGAFSPRAIFSIPCQLTIAQAVAATRLRATKTR